MLIQFLSIAALGIFYVIILYIGIWASKNRESGRSVQSMLVADRKLPLWIGVITMTATWVGGGYINGTAEAVFSSGIAWTQAPWGYALSLILGGIFFAKVMRQRNYTTLLDPFAEKYGDKVAALLFIPAFIGEIFWCSAILVALGATFSIILGIDLEWGIIISACFAIFYTLIGGLWAVAYTDVIQLGFILLGLAVAIPFAIAHIGSFSELWAGYQSDFGSFSQLLPPISAWSGQDPSWGLGVWTWLDFALLLICGGIPWGVYFQRVLACKTPESARTFSIFAGLLCILMAVPAVLIGMIASQTDWSLIGNGQTPDAAMALPYVLKYLTPSVIAIVGLGAVAAAVMSSIDSSVLSISSMFAWNLYRPLVAKNTSDRHLVVVIRFAIILVGVLATVMALSIKSVYALWFLCADLVYVILFPQLLMVLYWKNLHKAGAIAGIFVGLFLRIGAGEPTLGIPHFIAYPMQTVDGSQFPFRTFSMFCSLITIPLVSFLFNLREVKQPKFDVA